MKKLFALVAAFLMASSALAQDLARRETVGVDAHYESSNGNEAWAGSLSYGRIVMSNLEVAGAYTFEGANRGNSRVQGLQLIGRQWFGMYGKADALVPFVQIAGGFEFANSKYENVLGLGGGLGMFVSSQSELRLTLKREWGGFADTTRMDAGYYYHF